MIGKLEHEVARKSLTIAPGRLVENTRLDSAGFT